MKQLTLIVHADIEQTLADQLRALPQVSQFSFTHVEGHGPQDERDPSLSARDRVVGYTPHVRVDIVIGDEDTSAVLDALRRNSGGPGVACTGSRRSRNTASYSLGSGCRGTCVRSHGSPADRYP